MEWGFYSLDKKPINYDDLSKNEEIAKGIKIEPKLSNNYKIGNKIYHVSMIDIINYTVGVHKIVFKNIEEVDETLEEEFTCPYCGYIDYDAFELLDDGEIKCPNCNSKLEYTRQVRVEYEVRPVKRAKIINIE